MGGAEVVVTLLKVGAVLLLLIGALRLLARHQRSGGGGSSRTLRGRPSVLEVVDQTRLGRSSSVVAIRAGDRVMVLGVSETGGIEHLADISDDIDLDADEDPGSESTSVLDHALDILRTGDIRR